MEYAHPPLSDRFWHLIDQWNNVLLSLFNYSTKLVFMLVVVNICIRDSRLNGLLFITIFNKADS